MYVLANLVTYVATTYVNIGVCYKENVKVGKRYKYVATLLHHYLHSRIYITIYSRAATNI